MPPGQDLVDVAELTLLRDQLSASFLSERLRLAPGSEEEVLDRLVARIWPRTGCLLPIARQPVPLQLDQPGGVGRAEPQTHRRLPRKQRQCRPYARQGRVEPFSHHVDRCLLLAVGELVAEG